MMFESYAEGENLILKILISGLPLNVRREKVEYIKTLTVRLKIRFKFLT